MVVVDDLTETNQELKNRILQHQPSIGELATELFLFSVNEKSSEALMSDDFRENKMKEMENIIKEKRKKKAYWKPHAGKLFESVVVAEVRDDQNLPLTEAPNLPQKHREAGLPSAPVMASNRHVVGIFSRDAPETYDWLISSLLNLSWVRDVRPVHISNKSGNVRDEASRCTFAILYHSMGGRGINANSETDSLYDRELEGLSSCLGRDGVIMVIDDLEDSSLEAKHIFLKMQPSIGRWAVELFLFSDQEKTYQRRLLEGNMMAQMETLIKNKISRRGYSDSTGGALTHRRPNRQPSIPEPSIPKPSIPKPSLPKPSIPGLSSGNQNSWTIYLPVVFGFVLAALVVIFK
ncbi:hypothetical protein XENTR_v10023421 [Xenopus tropicalis]|nr:hypothetical protein XENTR_v10023421 [Xenopus tropicalis]